MTRVPDLDGHGVYLDRFHPTWTRSAEDLSIVDEIFIFLSISAWMKESNSSESLILTSAVLVIF